MPLGPGAKGEPSAKPKKPAPSEVPTLLGLDEPELQLEQKGLDDE